LATHGQHPEGQAVLWDGCEECERRGESPSLAVGQMDPETFARAWDRAWMKNAFGLPDVQKCEVELLDTLWAVRLALNNLTKHDLDRQQRTEAGR
jgi:hypothetical protein